MGFWSDSDYEKHEKALFQKLKNIFREMEIPELKDLCKKLIGANPKNKMPLLDKDGNKIYQFTDPITRKDYSTFYNHYKNLNEVDEMRFAKYLVKRKKLPPDDVDFVYVTTHSRDE